MAESARRTGVLPQPVPFGNYVLLEKISTGGMAEIFKAKAFGVEGFERFVAVKRIRPSIAEDEEFIRMFINEAKLASQLQHANIAQIFELGRVADDYFIAMEYVSGRDLRDLWDRARRQGQPLPPEISAFIVMKVCEALEYAHNKSDTLGNPLGIVHRDVSPQNILVSYEGTVKLVDFGVAKAANTSGNTQVGIVKGKLSYMSPEQVRGKQADARSDTFAAGICLYELITGERLFLGNTDFETLEKIRRMEVVPPSLYNPNIPSDLEQLILKTLSPDPEERFQSSLELAAALQRWLSGEGVFLSNRDLAGVMEVYFGGELAEERRRNESFRTQSMPAIDVSQARAALSWDDDESETAVFSKGRKDREDSERSVENFVPPPADVVWTRPRTEGSSSGARIPISGNGPAVPGTGKRKIQTSGSLPRVTESPSEGTPAPARDSSVSPAPMAQPSARPVGTASRRIEGAGRHTADVPRVPERKNRFGLAAALLILLIAGATAFWFLTQPGPPAPGTLVGDVDPPIANFEVRINGQIRTSGTERFVIDDLPPGTFSVRVSADRYQPIERQVTITEGATIQDVWQLERLRQVLTLNSVPEGATVSINGQERGAAPIELDSEEIGSVFTVRIEAEDHLPHEARIRFEDVEETLQVALEPARFELPITSTPEGARFSLFDAEDNRLAQGTTPESVEVPTDAALRIRVEAPEHEAFEQQFAARDVREGGLALTLTARTSETARPSAAPSPTPTAQQAQPTPPTTQQRVTVQPRPDPEPSRPERPRVTQRTAEPTPQPTERPRVASTPREPTPPTSPPPSTQQAAATGPPGTLNIRGRQRARVFIDGQDTGRTTPLENFAIMPGTYRVRLVFEELGSERTFRVSIEPGRTRTIMAEPD